MLQGVLPGSLKVPDQAFAKLQTKRDQLLALYTQHFNRYLSNSVITNKLNSDRFFLEEVSQLGGGHIGSFAIAQTKYVRKRLKDFTDEAKRKGLISNIMGRGYSGITVLVTEGPHQMVVKLPTSPATDFARGGHGSLAKEFDHVQGVAEIDGIDHTLLSRPVDNLSIRGKLLAHGFIDGKTYLAKDSIHSKDLGVVKRFSEIKTYDPIRVAELIKALAEIYKKQSILSYGDPPNVMITEGGKALSLIDLCPIPCTEENDKREFSLQKKIFENHAIAAALYQMISYGSLSCLTEGSTATLTRDLIIEANVDKGKGFFGYREALLRDSLQVLLDQNHIQRDELIQNLESLRDVNTRLRSNDMEYIKFKAHGCLTQGGMDMCQRLINHFKGVSS